MGRSPIQIEMCCSLTANQEQKYYARRTKPGVMKNIKDIHIERELPPEPEKFEYKQQATVVVTNAGDRVQVIIKQEKKDDHR